MPNAKPRKIKPRWTFKLRVRHHKNLWWRVSIYETKEAMHAGVSAKRKVDTGDYRALCRTPSLSEKRSSGCVGEMFFFEGNLYAHTLAHECFHAVINTLACLHMRDLVPPVWYVSNAVRGQFMDVADQPIDEVKSYWNSRHEHSAEMLDYFMVQMHDELVKRKIY